MDFFLLQSNYTPIKKRKKKKKKGWEKKEEKPKCLDLIKKETTLFTQS